MIVGLIGPISSGKETLAEYLVKEFDFEAVNILELFRQKVAKLDVQECSDNSGSQDDRIDLIK